jgi:hypothetical protein
MTGGASLQHENAALASIPKRFRIRVDYGQGQKPSSASSLSMGKIAEYERYVNS